MPRPFSESCEENKAPILAVLQEAFANRRSVLEVGSGSGQHALHFGRFLSHLAWQPSDVAENLDGIRAWLTEATPNVRPPLEIEVCRTRWDRLDGFDAVFSANTAHIMPWPTVKCMFAGVGRLLPAGGLFALYGPFNFAGRYTSESNARFDDWLKERDPASGIRDFEALDHLAEQSGMRLLRDYEMPANNRILLWQRESRG